MPDRRVRFHLDENVDPRIAVALRRESIDVTTTTEAGLRTRPDEEQLEFAVQSGRVLVTHDADLLALASTRPHSGIVFCAQATRSIGQIIETLVLIHGVLTPEEMNGHIEFI